MPAIDYLFYGALILAAAAAAYGGRAAGALVISNMATSLYGVFFGFDPALWLLIDLIVVGVIIVPGIVKWGGVTQRNLILCALFLVSWRFYALDISDPVQFNQLIIVTTSVATLQLLLSLPWGRLYHYARHKLKHEEMPPDSFFDERRAHGAGW